jgi:hypothetical protein
MQRTSSLALAAALLLLSTSAADAGGARGGSQPRKTVRVDEGRVNTPVFRAFDKSVKGVAAGTPLSRLFRVPRAKAKGGRGYTVKAEDATLHERTGSGARATVQLQQAPRAGKVRSATLRVPSRTRRGAELVMREGDGRLEISVSDPGRGSVMASLSHGPKSPREVSVTYYTFGPGDHVRTRPPVADLAEVSSLIAKMGFEPARGTRAGRAVADFNGRLKAIAADLPAEEQARLAPLMQLLTPAKTRERSLGPARTARAKSRTPASKGGLATQRQAHPNAPLFAEARRSLRAAAEGTPLTRQERVAARPGERAYTVDARKATLSQDGEHGRSSLHIENKWGKGFRPRGARVSVPGTGARGTRLEMAYTPHKLRIELRDQRRGTLEIALDNDVDTPDGIRYSVVDLAGSGESTPVSPAEALRFVREVGGFQPAPGTRAGVAVTDLAGRLAAVARRATPAERNQLAPFIAALGGAP